jgi:deoxyribonuclease V
MRIRCPHSWDVTPTEAVALQRTMAGLVKRTPPLENCARIAGADISYNRFSPTFYAGVVVLRTSDWTVIEKQGVIRETRFPYVPGLLTFREAPAVLEAFAKIRSRPDAVMIDGHGYAHPRRIGVASHIGLCLDLPTIGCAKTRLVGAHDEPGVEAGSTASLLHHDEVIGQVVRTKRNTRPLFISVGHKIDLASAVRWVLAACRGYRVPEPTRQAHLHVNELRRGAAC